ncbi:MAG: hypothetical protein GF309_07030 [Candidatus Lokiarchaeota archaeon]|nr:hypothetical protein [Candidatus Lokiarchaeota archaeon]
MKTKQKFSIFLCFLILGGLVLAATPDVRTTTYEGQLDGDTLQSLLSNGITVESEGLYAAEIAYDIAEINSLWNLRSVKLKPDVRTGELVWSFIWDKGDYVRKVRVDASTLKLVYYLDTSPIVSHQDMLNWDISRADAITYAYDWLNNIFDDHPATSVRLVEQRFDSWLVEFGRSIQGYNVHDNYIRIKVHPNTGRVFSFSRRWTDEFAQPVVEVSQREAIENLHEIGYTSCSLESERSIGLQWVSSDNCSKPATLAWIIVNDFGEFWISAVDGSFIRTGPFLVEYEGQSTNTDVVNEDPGDQMYDIMDYVFQIMDDELVSANKLNLPSKSEWLSASSSYVFFSTGHGSVDGTKNRIEISGHDDYQRYVYASDITNAPSRYLVYLLHCYSGLVSPGHEEDCVSYQFLWNSKRTTLDGRTYYQNAVIGFDSAVDTIDGTDFTEVFWDALADGDTVDQAFNDADSSYPEIGDDCVILGDTGVTL